MSDLLGFQEKHELLGQEFRSLVSQENQMAYDHVQDKRRSHKPVDSYPLRLRSVDGKQIQRWIVSAVPAPPASLQESLPETFGVMLSEQPSRHKLQVVDRAKVV
jgi:hypothetical protein